MRYGWMNGYLLQKRGVTRDFQPVWNWERYHIGGRMFAGINLNKDGRPCYINLKQAPPEAEFLRGQYKDILPGYYSDKRNWVSVRCDGAVPDELLRQMLDRAYGLTLAGMSKKARRLALGLTVCGLECAACPLYRQNCPGCNECAGRVFHAPAGKPCPLYACAAHRRRRTGCGGCPQAPCPLWEQVRDPALTEAEFRASVCDRLENWKGVPKDAL